MELYKEKIRYFCIGFCAAAILGYGLTFNFKDKAVQNVYVDMDKVITELTKVIASKKLAAPQIERAIESYRHALDKELSSYAGQHKCIIFSSPKPISGALDMTDYFLNKLWGLDQSALNKTQKTDVGEVSNAADDETLLTVLQQQEEVKVVEDRDLKNSEDELSPSVEIQSDDQLDIEKKNHELSKEAGEQIEKEHDSHSGSAPSVLNQQDPSTLNQSN